MLMMFRYNGHWELITPDRATDRCSADAGGRSGAAAATAPSSRELVNRPESTVL
jgi:hypothetical protein